MSENISGIRSVLSNPVLYELMHYLVGARRWLKIFLKTQVKPRAGENFLDVGCGSAIILKFLPDVNYTGFDRSEAYIQQANRRFSSRARFICDDVANFSNYELEKFDVGVAIGLLHHLNDDEVVTLLENVKKTMKSDSRFFIADPCYFTGQNPVIRFIISKDRGQNVRYIDEYLELCRKVFKDVKIHHISGFFPFPHSVLTMECR